MPAVNRGQFKDDIHTRYNSTRLYIQGTNRFDSPASLRLVSLVKEREESLKLTDMEFGDLEALARIDLDPEERDRLRLQLDRILGFLHKIAEVDTGSGTEEVSSTVLPSADEPHECLDREEVLGQAPDRENGFFRVPPVIDREGGGES
jgi:aspartyl-tRNA(Asn)/glutamyl-tRNA(Gln) amidotransferase subunit C